MPHREQEWGVGCGVRGTGADRMPTSYRVQAPEFIHGKKKYLFRGAKLEETRRKSEQVPRFIYGVSPTPHTLHPRRRRLTPLSERISDKVYN